MKYLTLVVALLLVASPVYSFWSTGHMIISRIALEELEQQDPVYLKQIQTEIDLLTEFSKEGNHSFVESAVWADDNKGISWSAFNGWHFVDTPVIDPDFKGETEYEAMNATWALYEMRKTLRNKNHPKFNSDLALSFAWRYLIHLAGDIHQPLHASSYYSAKFPNGDRGGNSFKINYPEDRQVKNLHALWDACVGQYGSIYAPTTETQYEYLSQVAANLTAEYPRSKVAARVSILDERVWADESNQIAKDYVYNGITPDSTPSEEYLKRGRTMIDEQLVVAGYRLADVMLTLRHSPNKSVLESLLK